MSKQQMAREIKELKAALGVFAAVPVDEEGDVWFYVGTAGQQDVPHLHTRDFIRAQELV